MAGRPRSRAKARAKASGTLAVQPSAAAFKRLEQAGIECGVDPLAMEQLVMRLQGRPKSAEGRLKLDDQELLSLIDDKLARAFQNLDDFALGQSSARDLSVTIGVLTDKRKALKPDGGPITTYKDYQKMDEVLKGLHAEAVRNGWLDNDGLTPKGAALDANTGNSSLP